MVQLFLAHPATILNARDEFGRAPLHIAAASCGRDVMDLLLAHPGADPNIPYTELFNPPMGSNEQRAPLHEAARKGNAAAAEALLDNGANPSPVTVNGTTPLHRAATWNVIDVTDVLLRHGADPNAQDYDEGWTLLHDAVIWNGFEEPQVIVPLLVHADTDPDVEDGLGLTPLHWAASNGSVYAVELLLDHGADPNTRDDNGETPLHWAARYGHLSVIRVLLDDRKTDVNAGDQKGYTPLHSAAVNNILDLVELLLDHGADPLILGDDNWDAIGIARRHGNDDVVDLLEPISYIRVNGQSAVRGDHASTVWIWKDRYALRKLAAQTMVAISSVLGPTKGSARRPVFYKT